MRSVADDLRREQRQRHENLTPAELMALTERLGEEGIAEMMSANGLDRAGALEVIRRSRRLGRKPSRCFDEDR